MLFRCPTTRRLVSLTGSSLAPLQLLQRTTGECLLAADRRREAMTPKAEVFQAKTRLATLDAYAANERVERAKQRERGENWRRMLLRCEVHQTAGAMKRFFALVDGLTSGQIHFALSLRFCTNFSVFSEFLKEVVRRRIRIRRGTPPADAVAFRTQLLRLCLARGPKLLQRHVALACLPNGDWRLRDVVEVHLPEAVDVTKERIADLVADAVQVVLAGRQIKLYPRHRWTGIDDALDQMCLLEGIHGLASAVYPLWAAFVTATAASSGAIAAPQASAAEGMASATASSAMLDAAAAALNKMPQTGDVEIVMATEGSERQQLPMTSPRRTWPASRTTPIVDLPWHGSAALRLRSFVSQGKQSNRSGPC